MWGNGLLHFFRSAYAQQRKTVLQHLAHGENQRQPRQPQFLVSDQHALGIILAVEFACQFAQVECDHVRGEILGRLGQQFREFR